MGADEPAYAYYANGEVYDRKGVTCDYYGRIQGLVRVNKHHIKPPDFLRELSKLFTEPTTERPLT